MATADFQPFNLAQIYGAADQANNQRLQNQVLQMQMQKAQQAQADDEALKGAFNGAIGPDGTIDRKTLYAHLAQVDPMKFMQVQQEFNKQDAELAKTQRETQAADITNRVQKSKYLRDTLANVTDQQSYENALNEAKTLGADFLTNSAPAQYDPNWVKGHVYDADKFITQNTPKIEMQDLGGKRQAIDLNPVTNPQLYNLTLDKTMTPGEIASNKIAQGNLGVNQANLGISRQRLGIDQQKLALEQQNGGQKAPAGYRYNADGSLTAIPGGPGDKTLNPTEVQGKAALFGTRAAEANKILSDLSAQGINTPGLIKQAAEGLPLVGNVAAMGINSLPQQLGGPSAKQQQVEQAQRDFVNAVLRQESGAAISESEFQNAKKQYFNQPGDSAEVKAQKAANRKTAIEGFKNMAGPIGKTIDSTISATNPLSVTAPDGKTYTFKSTAQANEFKRQAGIE